MIDELQQSNGQESLDETMASAVAAMPDIEALESGTSRAPNGQFAAKEPAEQPQADPAAAKPVDPAQKPADAKSDDKPAEDDEDYIELPPEAEGGETQRLKLSEVLDGYRRSNELAQQLETVRQQPTMPAELENTIAHALNDRAQLIQSLEQLEAFMRPVPPDLDLVNINSAKYNPEQYSQQHAAYQQAMQQLQDAREAREALQTQQAHQRQVIEHVRLQREAEKTLQMWPELKDPTVLQKMTDDVAKSYGFSAQEVMAVADSRVLAVIKDALAYRSGLAAKETAIKVVKAKPKLVRGQARATETGKQAQFAAASQRLSASHSLDDAAEAIGALI